jgi:hypothetical protein
MILTSINSTLYPDIIGSRQMFVGVGSGPGTYNSTTGDILSVALPGFQIDAVLGPAVTADNKYIAIPVPIGLGASSGWTLFWFNFVASAGSAPAWTVPTTVPTTEQVKLTVIGLS